jgi:hypothetical protein
MTSYLSIFFNTKETIENFNDADRDTLNLRATILLILSGMTLATESLFEDRFLSFGILMIIVLYLISGAMGLFIGGYATGYTILGMSRLFKGDSDFFKIKVVIVYAQIIAILQIPFWLIIGLSDTLSFETGIGLYTTRILGYLAMIFWLKVVIQGLMIVNKFNFLKAFFTLTPFYLIAAGFYIYVNFVLK